MKFIGYVIFTSLLFSGGVIAESVNKVEEVKPVNFLLITADDMNWDSVGVYGSQIDNITPNIDQFAQQGVRFNHSHVTTGVCQVSRGVLATGLYPHLSGIDGFYHTNQDIPTVINTLQQHGYYTALKGKVDHSTPRFQTKWDYVERKSPTKGRDKDKYYQFIRKSIQKAKAQNKPFYIMANSHDPHRPFAGSEQERRKGMAGKVPAPSRTYKSDEVKVPGFLPDLAKVRLEIAEYTSSVKRFDDTFGAILQALEDEGIANNTMVTFLSDNGMALPFAKSNNYLNSTKTPWIVRYPNKTKEDYVDNQHFISGIDFLPTILDTAGIEIPESLSGRSYLPLLKGESQTGRAQVFTMYYQTSSGNAYPMRTIQNKKHGYIFNPWSDKSYRFKNESQHGRSWQAMEQAATTSVDVAKRNEFFNYRVLEEFYNFEADPHALNNLIDSKKYQQEIDIMQKQLRQWMLDNSDPLLAAFDRRHDSEFLAKTMKKIKTEYKEKHKAKKGKKGKKNKKNNKNK